MSKRVIEKSMPNAFVNYKVNALDDRDNVVDSRIVPAWSASEAYLSVSNQMKPHSGHFTEVYKKGQRQ